MNTFRSVILINFIAYLAGFEVKTFTGTPNLVRSFKGKTNWFIWTVSQYASKNLHSVSFYYDSPKPEFIIRWNYGSWTREYSEFPDAPRSRWASSASAKAMRYDKKIKLGLYTIYEAKYSFSCHITLQLQWRGTYYYQNVSNYDAWAIYYKQPETPQITGPIFKNAAPRVRLFADVEVRQTLQLDCSCKSTSLICPLLPKMILDALGMRYRWIKDNGNITNSRRFSVYEGLLTIKSIRKRENNMKLACIAWEPGSIFSNYKYITVQVWWRARVVKVDPPSLTILASIGQRAVFKIYTTSKPPMAPDDWNVQISKRRNSQFIDIDLDEVQFVVNGTRAELQIPEVSQYTYGYYHVWGKNRFGGWGPQDLILVLQPPGYKPTLGIGKATERVPSVSTVNSSSPEEEGGSNTVLIIGTVLLIIVALIVAWKKQILPIPVITHTEKGYDRLSSKSEYSWSEEELEKDFPRESSEEELPTEKPQGTDVHIFAPTSVRLRSLFSDGDFYEVWKGKAVDSESSITEAAIKKVKDESHVYVEYLQSQADQLWKLRDHNHIIRCLGKTADNTLLVMEVASVGNLKQYIENKGSDNCTQTSVVKFILQITDGVRAVHQLEPPALFYCLCASNVLLSDGEKCKLTGFASAEAVQAREKWEEDKKFPRPIQWLSPEAITLKHVVQSDIWSLGVLLWELFSPGKLPLGKISNEEAKKKILNGTKPLRPDKCGDLYDTMKECWLHDPLNRPSLQDIELDCEDVLDEA